MDAAYIGELMRQHRAIEERLEALAIEAEAIRAAAGSLARHYAAEERFLEMLGARDARLAAKLRGQHDEALEIAARLLETLEAGQDGRYLARRLAAIAQHNIIEEERDVFPLVGHEPDQF